MHRGGWHLHATADGACVAGIKVAHCCPLDNVGTQLPRTLSQLPSCSVAQSTVGQLQQLQCQRRPRPFHCGVVVQLVPSCCSPQGAAVRLGCLSASQNSPAASVQCAHKSIDLGDGAQGVWCVAVCLARAVVGPFAGVEAARACTCAAMCAVVAAAGACSDACRVLLNGC